MMVPVSLFISRAGGIPADEYKNESLLNLRRLSDMNRFPKFSSFILAEHLAKKSAEFLEELNELNSHLISETIMPAFIPCPVASPITQVKFSSSSTLKS
ncbi:MAG: hypothetical protein L6Q59_03880 [Ignavibacteriaceae bacterium]|nr:hypothetical protein [Ignavibacteriaceae bacterium]